ncbi:MAG: hypothetical protein R2749_26195 [Acidimicrobiales bacterium]
MSTDAVTLFFALLAVVVQLAVVATLVALVAGGANVRSRLVDTIGPDATKLALAIATTATLGSLYLSEVANFIPCRLCWIQRGSCTRWSPCSPWPSGAASPSCSS